MAEQSCVFCNIVLERIPADFVYRDGSVVAFRDINPVAPTHILVAPREHIESLADVTELQWPLIDATLRVAQQIAREQGIDATGYRIISNHGPDSGQLVPHLHWHLIGGKPLGALVG